MSLRIFNSLSEYVGRYALVDENTLGKKTIVKVSPVTGKLMGEFEICGEQEVKQSVARARRAFEKWVDSGLDARLAAMQRVKQVILKHAEDYARRISDDTGKPMVDSLITELFSIPLFLEHYRKRAKKILAPRKVRTPLVFQHKKSYLEYFPMGVIGIISPWNFPFQLSVIPIISALIGGNTVVLKPSEVTPVTGEVIREMFEEAGFPQGVVEVVQGDGATGAALVTSDVDKIFFTGSVATGRKVMAAAAARPIPVELELGGKDAMIICADANLKRAVRAAAWGGLVNAGQMCISVERIFVEEEIHDEFVGMLKKEVERLTVGGPDQDADMGPITFPKQIQIVTSHIEQAREAGAQIISGGNVMDGPGDYFAPTIIVGVTRDMNIYREETFGPVLPVIKVKDSREAVELANDHQYGLAASVWTSDLKKGRTIASALECGQVMVNDVVASVANPALPFGGVKSSGIGRYHGEEGLLSFMHTKAIMVDPGKLEAEPFWFPYAGKYQDALKAFYMLVQGKFLAALGPLKRMDKINKRAGEGKNA